MSQQPPPENELPSLGDLLQQAPHTDQPRPAQAAPRKPKGKPKPYPIRWGFYARILLIALALAAVFYALTPPLEVIVYVPQPTVTGVYESTIWDWSQPLLTVRLLGEIPAWTQVYITGMSFENSVRVYSVTTADQLQNGIAYDWDLIAPTATPGPTNVSSPTPTHTATPSPTALATAPSAAGEWSQYDPTVWNASQIKANGGTWFEPQTASRRWRAYRSWLIRGSSV